MKLTSSIRKALVETTVKVPMKLMRSTLYPKGRYLYSGTDELLGKWGDADSAHKIDLEKCDVIVSFNGSGPVILEFDPSKAADVKAFIAAQRAKESSSIDRILAGVEESAHGLWTSVGPFMTSEVVEVSDSKVRLAVSQKLTELGYRKRTLSLFKPVVVWFKYPRLRPTLGE